MNMPHKVLTKVASLIMLMYVCSYVCVLSILNYVEMNKIRLGAFGRILEWVLPFMGISVSVALIMWSVSHIRNRIVRAIIMLVPAIIQIVYMKNVIEKLDMAISFLRNADQACLIISRFNILIVNAIRIMCGVAIIFALITIFNVLTRKLPLSDEKKITEQSLIDKRISTIKKIVKCILITVNVIVALVLLWILVNDYRKDAEVNAYYKDLSYSIYSAASKPELVEDTQYAKELTLKGLQTFGMPLILFLLLMVNRWIVEERHIITVLSYIAYMILTRAGVALIYERELTYYGGMGEYYAMDLIDKYLIIVYVAIGVVIIAHAWIKGVKAGVDEIDKIEKKA